jgi:acyl-coenzyme A synthetase/AMP-(fatty) acid ligase
MALKAFVVMAGPVPDRKAATRALQDHVKQKLVPYKYPRLIEFLPELPKTGTGKIDRQALLTRAVAAEPIGSAGQRSSRPIAQPRRARAARGRGGAA